MAYRAFMMGKQNATHPERNPFFQSVKINSVSDP
jgi:hypothetical protein